MSADDLAKLLDELGKRLGPAGSHVFDLAVRQQLINGGVEFVAGLLVVIAGIVMFVVARRHPGSDGFEWMPLGGGFIFGGLFLFNSVPPLLNPEWCAIRDILGAIK